MNPELLYAKRIKDLEREIRNLKTTYFKTATTINTMTLNQTLNFSLTLDTVSGNIFSTQRAIITLRTNNSNMINACYLNGMTPSNLDDRVVNIQRLNSNDNEIRYSVAVFSFNATDWQTLYNGGSVDLTYTVQLVGSSEFSSSLVYKAITGGSE